MKRTLARSITAAATALALGVTLAAPLAHAESAEPAMPPATLAAAIEQNLAGRDLSAAMSASQSEAPAAQAPAAPAQPSSDRGFFSGTRGVFAIGLMVIGTAWVVKSTFSDRIDNPVRK